MINWNDFEHIHVIKKLKHVLHSWWSVDILFTDERGQLKGLDSDKVQFANPAVNFLIHKDATKASLAELVATTVNELRSSHQRFVFKKWDAVGFDLCILDNSLSKCFCVFSSQTFNCDLIRISSISSSCETPPNSS